MTDGNANSGGSSTLYAFTLGGQAPPEPCGSFTDVYAGSIFYEDVRFVACRGIVNGFPNVNTPPITYRFEPNSNTRRGEFTKMIANGFGITVTTPTTPLSLTCRPATPSTLSSSR